MLAPNKLVTVHGWPMGMHLAVDELHSDQAFTVISVATPATEDRVQARAVIREALRDTLATFLGQPAETVLLISRPGQPISVDSSWGCLHLSLSHMPGLSVAAIGRGCAVGVDLMQADPRTPAMQGWRLVARDYLGQSVSLLLDNMPPTQRTVAFTEAWTRLESCLKCNGLPLTEWSSDLAHKLLNCHVVALDLPANCRGSIAVRKKKMAD